MTRSRHTWATQLTLNCGLPVHEHVVLVDVRVSPSSQVPADRVSHAALCPVMLGGIVIGNQVGGGWGGGLVRPLNHHDPPARIRQAWIPDPRPAERAQQLDTSHRTSVSARACRDVCTVVTTGWSMFRRLASECSPIVLRPIEALRILQFPVPPQFLIALFLISPPNNPTAALRVGHARPRRL